MVCFTQNRFEFHKSMAKNWFKVLVKYYQGIECTANNVNGRISEKFFSELPEVDTYTVTTTRYWDQHATLQCLPRFEDLKMNICIKKDNLSENASRAKSAIQDVISRRLHSGHFEIFYSAKYDDIKKEELLPVLAACDLENSNVSSTEDSRGLRNVNRFYYSKIDDCVFLVLKDSHGIKITLNKVQDSSLGNLDLDDGFCQNSFQSAYIPSEWQTYFLDWRKKFDESEGKTWNDPIIPQTLELMLS